jgi:hypothetical protein
MVNGGKNKMSLETWKEEFYSTDAYEYVEESKYSEIDCVLHSLTKWIGLREENLKKHELSTILSGSRIIKDQHNEMCAGGGVYSSMCRRYQKERKKFNDIEPDICSKCIGRIANKEKCSDQYDSWYWHQDPEPMIAWMENTLEYVKEKISKK